MEMLSLRTNEIVFNPKRLFYVERPSVQQALNQMHAW